MRQLRGNSEASRGVITTEDLYDNSEDLYDNSEDLYDSFAASRGPLLGEKNFSGLLFKCR